MSCAGGEGDGVTHGGQPGCQVATHHQEHHHGQGRVPAWRDGLIDLKVCSGWGFFWGGRADAWLMETGALVGNVRTTQVQPETISHAQYFNPKRRQRAWHASPFPTL